MSPSATRSDLDGELNPLPRAPGTYALVLEPGPQSVGQHIRVGALGKLPIEGGTYVYVGSARGPGGLAARVARHLRATGRPHWHIDYLRRHTHLTEIWLAVEDVNHEHEWSRLLAHCPGLAIPLPRFGASDCRCPSHLFHCARQPGAILQRLGGAIQVPLQTPGGLAEAHRLHGPPENR